MKRPLYLLFLLFIFPELYAQPYDNAVAVKAGYSSGLIISHSFDRFNIGEMQAVYNNHGFQLHGLYKYQFSPYSKKRLYYYAGGGFFGGNWDEEKSAGLAALVGMEYMIRKTPLGVAAEWKPMLNVYESFATELFDISLCLRIIIN